MERSYDRRRVLVGGGAAAIAAGVSGCGAAGAIDATLAIVRPVMSLVGFAANSIAVYDFISQQLGARPAPGSIVTHQGAFVQADLAVRNDTASSTSFSNPVLRLEDASRGAVEWEQRVANAIVSIRPYNVLQRRFDFGALPYPGGKVARFVASLDGAPSLISPSTQIFYVLDQRSYDYASALV